MIEPTRAERVIKIVNHAGMHARPAAKFVKLAGSFASQITLTRDGLEVDGKSIMGVLMLSAEQGASLLVTAQGDDASDAVQALADLVGRNFEEN